MVPLYRRVAVALFAVFALLAGSAASALAQSPKPDPAPAAQQQQQTSKGTTSGSTHSSPSPAPAAAPTKTYTPTPTYTPAPTTSSASTPSTSNPATTSTPKHTVTNRAKPKAVAKKNARHAKPAAKKAKPAAPAPKPKPKPAPTPIVHSAPASVNLPTVPPAGDSGSSLSNRSVLLMAFVLVIGVGILALLARGLWRRVWWWRRYHEPAPGGRPAREDDAVRARATVVEPWPAEPKANGANGHALDDEPATFAPRAAADDVYR